MAVKHAKGGIAGVNHEEVYWMEWTPKKSGKLTAFAIDPKSVERTGKLRALNGSLVPASAVPAKSTTDKDHFSVTLMGKLRSGSFSTKAKRTKEPHVEKNTAPNPEPREPFTGIRRKDGKSLGHPQDYTDSHYEIVINDRVVAEIEKDKVNPDEEVVFRLTDKSWGIYQHKARKAFGRLTA